MTGQDTKQETPTWLSYIENCMEEDEENFKSNAPYYEIMRDLLLRSDEPDEAISQAIRRSYDQYTGEIDDYNARIEDNDPEPPKRREYDFDLLDNTMTELVLEMMGELPYLDPKTNTLSKFLIGLNKHTKDMRRKSSGDVISAVREAWDASHADSMSFKTDHSGVEGAINRWLNVASLIAQLYKADLLEDYGQMWIAHDFRRTFEERKDGDITKQPIKQAQVLAIVNYMLIAGEPFAEAAKAGKDEMTAEKWRLWAEEMKKVADVVGESVRWNLKERAKRASAMMVELYPEAFEERD